MNTRDATGVALGMAMTGPARCGIVLLGCSHLLAGACTSTSYRVAGYSQRFGDQVYVATSSVDVFEGNRFPKRAYSPIGIIEVAGGPDSARGELLQEARRRARSMGAHALVGVEFEKDVPKHVRSHREKVHSPGKTGAAILFGALLAAGAIAAAATAEDGGSRERDHSDDDEESDDVPARRPSRERRVDRAVSVLRAQAVRYASAPAQEASPERASLRDWLATQLRGRGEELHRCLPDQPVELLLDWRIDTSGRVIAIAVQDPSIFDSGTRRCVEATVANWVLDPPPHGGRLSMTHPLHLYPGAPERLFFFGLRANAGVEPGLAEFGQELLAEALDELPAFEVSTAADIEMSLLAERERDLLGCADVTCAVEIGNALDADLLAYGTVSTSERERSFSLTILERSGEARARAVVVADSNTATTETIEALVDELLVQLRPVP